MKFTEEQTVKFVLEFIKHECLIDSNSPKHRNKIFRKAALQQLSQKMNIPGFGAKEAYAKARSLKSTYFQENKKIQQSKLAGDRYIYTPNVKWFKILDNALKALNFPEDSGDAMTTSANIPNYVQDDEPNYSNEDPQITQVKSETEDELWLDISNDCSTVIDSPSTVNEDDTRSQKQEKTRLILSNNPRKRRLSAERDESNSKMAADASNMADNFENEFDIFGKSVAAQLKNMPFDLAIEAQMYIQKHLCEIRLKNYKRTSAVLKYDDGPQLSSTFI